MDMFNLLARGAILERHGKDLEALEIVSVSSYRLVLIIRILPLIHWF